MCGQLPGNSVNANSDSVGLEKYLRVHISSKLQGNPIATGLETLNSKASTLRLCNLLAVKG